MNLIILCFLLFLLDSTYSDECFDAIKKLSDKDKCLNSRLFLKRAKSQIANNSDEFLNLVKNIECNGTEFSCGNTMSWVTEVFLGVKSQYQESKYDDGFYGGLAGYGLTIGNQLINFFETGRMKNESLIYQFR